MKLDTKMNKEFKMIIIYHMVIDVLLILLKFLVVCRKKLPKLEIDNINFKVLFLLFILSGLLFYLNCGQFF